MKMENAIMQMVFGHMMRGKTSAGMRRNRSQKVSAAAAFLLQADGALQAQYLLQLLKMIAEM